MNLNWTIAKIEEIAEVNPRLGKAGIPDDLPVSFVPMPAVGAGDGLIDVSQVRPFGEVKKGFTSFQQGDVLFAKITPCMENGKMAIVPKVENGYAFGSTEFHVLRPKPGIDARYIYYYISSRRFRGEAEHQMSGAVGQKRVPTQYLRECTIPLAPLNEQTRIVAEIEKQFSRLDEGVANLKRVKANLKRYKAAVLKAAVEGKLTEEWRKQHRDVEPVDKLLERILAERRANWQGRGKYKEPAAPDTTDLPELPAGWGWISLDTLIFGIETGKSFKCDERPPQASEVGVVKVSAVTWGDYDENESKTCLDDSLIKPELYVRTGEFLFSRANTIELVGACVIVENVTKNIMLSDKILRFKLANGTEWWVLHFLRSMFGRSEIERLATGNQESMRNIGQDRIRAIRIPIPPVPEQEVLLTEIERFLSIVAGAEAQIDANLRRADRLRQSILKQAFSGASK